MRSVDRCFGTHCRGKPFIGYADAGDGTAFSDGFAERVNPEAERIERNFKIFAKVPNSFFRALGSILRTEYGIGAAPGPPGADGIGGQIRADGELARLFGNADDAGGARCMLCLPQKGGARSGDGRDGGGLRGDRRLWRLTRFLHALRSPFPAPAVRFAEFRC